MKRAKIARALRQKTVPTPHKQTNFERITASPEALAPNLAYTCCVHSEDAYEECQKDERSCAECRLAWLKEEAK